MPIALGVLLVAVLALGFMSMQAMLERLTQEQQSDAWWAPVLAPFNAVLHVLNRAQRAVWEQLVAIMSRFAGASLHALAHWFWSLEHLVTDTAHGIASLAETVADAFEHALGVTVPHAIRVAVQHEGRLRRIADEQLRRYARGIDRLLHDHVLPRLRAAERAITVAIPRQFERAWARDRAIAGRIPAGLRSRLRHVERVVAPAAIFAVVLTRLFRRWPWLACRRLVHPRRGLFARMCGLNTNLFETLLADLLVVGGALSVVEFVKDLQTIEDEVVDFMTDVVPELRDILD